VAGIRFEACLIGGAIAIEDNVSVEFEGCTISGAMTANRDTSIVLNSIRNTGAISITNAGQVEALRNMGGNCSWSFGGCGVVDCDIENDGADAVPVLFRDCTYVRAALDLNDNTGDGVEFVGCARVEPGGLGITGSGNTGYGARFGAGGYYVMDGVDIEGDTGEFIAGEQAYTWANLASYGSVVEQGVSVVVLGG
jgi:hypothetical protein